MNEFKSSLTKVASDSFFWNYAPTPTPNQTVDFQSKNAVAFNFPNKTMSLNGVKFNIINNFLITDSKITQNLDSTAKPNLTDYQQIESKLKKEYQTEFDDKVKQLLNNYNLNILNKSKSEIEELKKQRLEEINEVVLK